MGLRLPVRGVDMFRNPWCASVDNELSNALAAWTYDSKETLSAARNSMSRFHVNLTVLDSPSLSLTAEKESAS